MAQLYYGYKTDTGRIRTMNQDSGVILPADELDHHADGLFVIADGMGGRAGGEIASRVTVETVPDVVREMLAEKNGNVDSKALSEAVREGIVAANDAVWKQSKANPELRGMGTTCVVALVHGNVAVLGNVGDSRIYLLRGDRFTQVTSDHSLVQEHIESGDISQTEARSSRYRNVITRAVGIHDRISPDVHVIDLNDGDTLLLCSDGLTNMVTARGIAAVLAGTADPQEASDKLVDVANEQGGRDNITVCVVRRGEFVPHDIAGLDPPAPSDLYVDPYVLPPDKPRPRISWAAWLLLLVLGLTAAALFVVDRLAPIKQPKPTPVVPKTTKIDLARLKYDDPIPVLDTPVRGVPLICDNAGNVFAVTLPGKIQRITLAGKVSGEFPTILTVDPPQDRHYAADSQGNLYIASRSNRHIYKFLPTGTRIGIIPATGSLDGPEGIAVDARGDIFVVDNRVLKVIKAHPAPPKAPKQPKVDDGPR